MRELERTLRTRTPIRCCVWRSPFLTLMAMSLKPPSGRLVAAEGSTTGHAACGRRNTARSHHAAVSV
jgi:hypothetical protein